MDLKQDMLLQGRYRIGELLAQGGMGAVYRATDERLGNTVALKQTLMRDPSLRAAFEREARLLASLSHPALPVVSDHFIEQDGQFLVMQFIPGPDLATMLQERAAPFSPAEVDPWATSLLDALEYLHGRTPPIIHRDIKPQNLKLAAHGGVILLDFGLAKGQTSTMAQGDGASLFGYTPQYAPIEQIQGSGTNERSDLYAVAATLYNLLTGSPPADALTRVTASVRNEPDPLRSADSLNPAIPPELAAELTRGLSINPEFRHSSAVAMRNALRAAFQGQPAPAVAETKVTAATPPPAAAAPPSSPPPVAAAPKPATKSQAFMPIAVIGMVFVALCMGAGLLLTAALFTRSNGTVANPPTNLPATVIPAAAPVSDEVLPTTPPAAPLDPELGYSRSSPLPMDTPLEFGGWRVEVVAQVRGEDAYEQLRRANANNGPPDEGMEYLLLNFRLTSMARDSQSMPGNALRVLGARGEAYSQTANVAPSPRLERSGDVASGAEVGGWAAFMVGLEEEHLLLALGSNSILAESRFVALSPNASLSEFSDRSGLQANQVGQEWREPATIDQEVITDDWIIRIEAVIRGEEAWERIQAHNRFNDPAPPGREYLLAYVHVRYIGVEETPKLINNGYFTATDGTTEPERVSVNGPEPRLSALLFPGGSASGWITLTGVADTPDARIVFKHSSIGFRPDHFNTRYFALE
ncbi:serine/threonine protein kinase [Candidatus Viridilinea mediisalina]|uniref:Protein kinase domain-containing protein n=1 Tax=Candidatus Viridilinea mediisalina TaxID=2024553 RepID=A0A2A6RPJ7_9CHLR|nr:serine/threonine-protein kinase [Candidatus Viridilinea mediisalina]PDW04863.1 hypothetical protein CJ255_01255 [Candidatus Viridilinea mediisalina]